MPPNQLPSTTNNGDVATFYASRVDKNGEYEHFKRDVPSLEKVSDLHSNIDFSF